MKVFFWKFIKFKVKEVINESYEEKYYNTKGIIANINSLFQKKKEKGKIENEELKYDINKFLFCYLKIIYWF